MPTPESVTGVIQQHFLRDLLNLRQYLAERRLVLSDPTAAITGNPALQSSPLVFALKSLFVFSFVTTLVTWGVRTVATLPPSASQRAFAATRAALDTLGQLDRDNVARLVEARQQLARARSLSDSLYASGLIERLSYDSGQIAWAHQGPIPDLLRALAAAERTDELMKSGRTIAVSLALLAAAVLFRVLIRGRLPPSFDPRLCERLYLYNVSAVLLWPVAVFTLAACGIDLIARFNAWSLDQQGLLEWVSRLAISVWGLLLLRRAAAAMALVIAGPQGTDEKGIRRLRRAIVIRLVVVNAVTSIAFNLAITVAFLLYGGVGMLRP